MGAGESTAGVGQTITPAKISGEGQLIVMVRGAWLLLLLGLLGGCASVPTPEPAQREEAIRTAVAATAAAFGAVPANAPTTVVVAAPTATTAPVATATLVGSTNTGAAATPPAKPVSGTPIGTTGPASTPIATKPAPVAGSGTGTPVAAATAPTRSTQTARLTPEEAQYIAFSEQTIREFNGSFGRFRALIENSRTEDAAWRQSLEAELTLWARGADASQVIRAPEAFLPAHRRLMGGLDLYQLAAVRIVEGLSSSDETRLRRGLETVIEARVSFEDAERELVRIARERAS